MPKDVAAGAAEKRWKTNADARAKKAAEKVALLIDTYYHLKKQIEDSEGATATGAVEKKRQEALLATLEEQLKKIESQIRKRQENLVGELESTLALEQLTQAASSVSPKKSSTTTATVHKLKSGR